MEEVPQESIDLDPEKLLEYAQKILSLAKQKGWYKVDPYNLNLEIVLVDSETSAQLNEAYKNRKGPATVLTFDLRDEFSKEASVVLCLEKIASSLESEKVPERNWNLKDEVYWLVTHACLHLLGYKHSTPEEWDEMIEKQKLLMKEVYGKTKWWLK